MLVTRPKDEFRQINLAIRKEEELVTFKAVLKSHAENISNNINQRAFCLALLNNLNRAG